MSIQTAMASVLEFGVNYGNVLARSFSTWTNCVPDVKKVVKYNINWNYLVETFIEFFTAGKCQWNFTSLSEILAVSGAYLGGGACVCPSPLGVKTIFCANIYYEKIMLHFYHFWKCTPEMYPLGTPFSHLITPLGGLIVRPELFGNRTNNARQLSSLPSARLGTESMSARSPYRPDRHDDRDQLIK